MALHGSASSGGSGAPTTRLISTTAPLAGGGDLSADRTLSIVAATASVPGSMSAADKTKLDAISGTNTGDQTIALSSDVTGTGTGAITTTVVSATGNGTDFVVASPNRLKLSGNGTMPTPATTDAYVLHNTTNGLVVAGNGSSFDYQLLGAAGSALMTVIHNSTTVNITPGALSVAGAVSSGGSILSTSATGGIGYNTGAGGAVTQATSRTTGVTLNKACGAITLFSAAGSATYNTFTVTNSAVAATDVIEVSQKSGANLYNILVTAVAAGSFNLSVSAVSGTATEAPVINFTVCKAVTA